jgi:hypothetical protein
MPREALVVGYARCVWADLRAARPLVHEPAVFAVNKATMLALRIDHAVSHHAEALGLLVRCRQAFRSLRSLSPKITAHSVRPAEGIDRVWPDLRSGDSGLLAARIAVALGYEKVILAGVPLDDKGHVDDDAEATHFQFSTHRHRWQEHAKELQGRVTSMSGWTRELLGAAA